MSLVKMFKRAGLQSHTSRHRIGTHACAYVSGAFGSFCAACSHIRRGGGAAYSGRLFSASEENSAPIPTTAELSFHTGYAKRRLMISI